MLIVVSYDVPDDRRRTRLAHILKDFGERVQYSVFECRLDERALRDIGLDPDMVCYEVHQPFWRPPRDLRN